MVLRSDARRKSRRADRASVGGDTLVHHVGINVLRILRLAHVTCKRSAIAERAPTLATVLTLDVANNLFLGLRVYLFGLLLFEVPRHHRPRASPHRAK